MTQNKNVLTKIAWLEVFPFTRLFKGFSVAMRLGMLTLGVAMLILIFAGGMILDTIWSTCGETMTPGEITFHTRDRVGYETKKIALELERTKKAAGMLVESRRQADSLGNYLTSINTNSDLHQAFSELLMGLNSNEKIDPATRKDYYTILKETQDAGNDWDGLVGDIEDQNERELDKIDEILDESYEKACKNIQASQDLTKEAKSQRLDALDQAFADAQKAVTLRKLAQKSGLQQLEGIGIFDGFVAYERNCVYNAVMAVRYLNFTGGISDYAQFRKNRKLVSTELDPATGLAEPAMVRSGNDAPGMIYFLLLAVEGVIWLISVYPTYSAVFLLWCLVVWAILGGAMYRMAAMRFARNQSIGISEAVGFSLKRISTFFSAPLVPLLIIAALGIIIALLSLLGNIPIVGPTILAIIYGAFIVIGMAMAGILIFYVFSVPLQYPILAVSSCDACGAVSDSYSYSGQKLFHLIFYGVVASIYGMLTYLFVRLFAFIGLTLVHCFCKAGIFTGDGSLGRGGDTMDVLWAKPEYWNLHDFNFMAAGPWESVCSFFIGIWVNLVVAVVAAYLISYFISSSTITYFLIRSSCEATDYDDIYVEGEDEAPLDIEFAEKTEPVEEQAPATQEKTEDSPAEE